MIATFANSEIPFLDVINLPRLILCKSINYHVLRFIHSISV